MPDTIQRRRALTYLAGAGAVNLAHAADWNNAFAKSWRDSFLRHWEDTKTYTLAIFDAMPADGMEVKPNPEQRTFADQFVHIAGANNAYVNAFNLGKGPAAPKARDKETVRKYLVESFDYVNAILLKMTEKDLLRNDLKFNTRLPPHSGTDVFMRAYMHTAHHRGQAVVYLRVKNIVPPAWKFEPTAS